MKQWPALLRPPPRVAHASRLDQKRKKERRAKVGNNNGQLRIATPPRVAHAKSEQVKPLLTSSLKSMNAFTVKVRSQMKTF